ncbi:MAG: vitamin B12 dependent-methionine synthase activation domain-containing protein [Desulfobacterales bacterium]|jgi:hypothetical protein
MPIIDNIKIDISQKEVRRRLHMAPDSDLSEIQPLIDVVMTLIAPRALYDVRYIEEKSEDAVIVGGMRFKSRVLRKNLDQVERIFPFVITLGPKLGEKQAAGNDLLENYYLDSIGNVALNSARMQLKRHLESKFALEKISSMAPGSLADWPIEEQAPLFKLLGDVEASIGVNLTSSLLMLPAKSISGIYFPKEVSFVSCQLCPKERCESRKAKYNPKMAKEYGIIKD